MTQHLAGQLYLAAALPGCLLGVAQQVLQLYGALVRSR